MFLKLRKQQQQPASVQSKNGVNFPITKREIEQISSVDDTNCNASSLVRIKTTTETTTAEKQPSPSHQQHCSRHHYHNKPKRILNYCRQQPPTSIRITTSATDKSTGCIPNSKTSGDKDTTGGAVTNQERHKSQYKAIGNENDGFIGYNGGVVGQQQKSYSREKNRRIEKVQGNEASSSQTTCGKYCER